ncbi:MAG: cytochrome C oxidase subunit IV family protein [Planctomycetota bacterium]|jgi:cytochrome c oxidase subunit 4
MAQSNTHAENAHTDSHDVHHGHGSSHGDHHGFSHPMPIWMLLSVFFALLFLTGLTVFQAQFDLGNAEIWMSLTIATIKAGLVILFFMHLLWDKPLNAIVILGSLIFVALFLGFTLMDAEGYREKLIFKSTITESQPGYKDPATLAAEEAAAAASK